MALSRIVFVAITLLLFLGVPGLGAAQTGEGPAVLPPPNFAPAEELPALGAEKDPIEAEELAAPAAEEIVGEEDSAAPALELTPEYKWFQPAYWFGPTPWDIGIEFGINGTEGVNSSSSLRVGGHIKRKTEDWKLNSSFVYNRNQNNGVETQNNALLDMRVDRLLEDSPWTLYFINQELYDEFQAFDLRVSINAGVGYQLIDQETFNLIGRFGPGTSREFGASDDFWNKELLFGIDYEHKLSPTQRFTAKVDYYPEWENFNLFRVVTDLGWEIDLDTLKNMSLKFSVVDRYDSTPNGAKANEINYSALLIFGF